jgi:ribosome-associated heat shock protein Hsp15
MSEDSIRLDRWLWFARFLKSRTLAAALCADGRVRLSGHVVGKPSQPLKVGDVLTFPLGPHIRVIEVRALGTRRGPAEEARTLYADLSPPPPRVKPEEAPQPAAREPGTGRPTKADRRAIDRFTGES